MEKWISLYGTFEHNINKIMFKGGTVASPQNIKNGLYILNQSFWEGTIKAKVKFKNIDASNTGCCIVINYNPTSKNFICVGIGGTPKHMYVMTECSPVGWNDIELSGERSNLVADYEYSFEVKIIGNKINFFVA